MANAELTLILKAKDLASAQVGKLHNALDKVGVKATSTTSIFSKLGNATGGLVTPQTLAATAILGVGAAMFDAAKAAGEEQINVAKLNASLKANIPGWDGNTAAIEQLVSVREKLAFSDDDLRDSLAILVAATHDVTKAESIQATAMDLSRLKGISLQDASTALIKVEGGHYRALQALGIKLKEGATETDALAAVQDVAAGQAEAYGNTTKGVSESVGIAFQDLKEDIGSALLPALRDLSFFVRDSVIPAIRNMGDLRPVLLALGVAFGIMLAPVIIAQAPLILMASAVALVAANMDNLAHLVSPLADSLGGLNDVVGSIPGPWHNAMGDISDSTKQTVKDVIELGKTPEAIADDLRESRSHVYAAAQSTLAAPLETAAKAGAKAVDKSVDDMHRSLRDGASQVKTDAKNLAEALVHPISAALRRKELNDILLGRSSVGKKLIAGLHSADPIAQEAARELKNDVLAQLSQLNRTFTSNVKVNLNNGPKRMATGGPVGSNQVYTIGENGPETLVMGSQSGYIVPGRQASGGGGVPVQIPIVIDGREIARVVDSHLYYIASTAGSSLRRT